MARTDSQRGFWWFPSNQLVYDISGLSRPVDFTLGDVNSRANYLRLTEEYRGAGMPAPLDIDLGLERLEASWVMSDYDANIVSLWCVGEPVSVVFWGAAVGQDGTTTPIVLTMRGLINVLDRGDWTPGEKPTLTVTTGLTYYQGEIGGQVLHEIDPAAPTSRSLTVWIVWSRCALRWRFRRPPSA